MPELEDRSIPLEQRVSEGALGVALVFKLLALLRKTDKIDDDELRMIGTSLIAELDGTKLRFETWTTLETWLPEFKRPDEEQPEAERENKEGDEDRS